MKVSISDISALFDLVTLVVAGGNSKYFLEAEIMQAIVGLFPHYSWSDRDFRLHTKVGGVQRAACSFSCNS